MPDNSIDTAIADAARILQQGGVVAYPTEQCFGLGCDPHNHAAIEKVLAIKRRRVEQGVILLAGDIDFTDRYSDWRDLPRAEHIQQSWPGPFTWLLPAKDGLSTWLRGEHSSIALRVSAHPVAAQLSREFGDAIVSTSANRHGQTSCLTAKDVLSELGAELDYILDAPVGGDENPSTILDALTGEQIR